LPLGSGEYQGNSGTNNGVFVYFPAASLITEVQVAYRRRVSLESLGLAISVPQFSVCPGSLTITKNITGVATVVVGSSLSFPFTVDCKTPAASYSGSVTVLANSLNASSSPVSLAAGSTSCTVTETMASRPIAPAGYVWAAPTYSQPSAGAVAPGGTFAAAIVNPLQGVVTQVPALHLFALAMMALMIVGATVVPLRGAKSSKSNAS